MCGPYITSLVITLQESYPIITVYQDMIVTAIAIPIKMPKSTAIVVY